MRTPLPAAITIAVQESIRYWLARAGNENAVARTGTPTFAGDRPSHRSGVRRGSHLAPMV